MNSYMLMYILIQYDIMQIWEQNKLIAELQKKNAELEETIAHYEEQI